MVRVKAGEILVQQGINAMVINMATVKPLDEELVLAAAKKCGKIITCEEHSVIGGLDEAVCSLLSEKLPTPVRRIGVNDEFGHSGPAGALLKAFGLTSEHIVDTKGNALPPAPVSPIHFLGIMAKLLLPVSLRVVQLLPKPKIRW